MLLVYSLFLQKQNQPFGSTSVGLDREGENSSDKQVYRLMLITWKKNLVFTNHDKDKV